MQRVKQEVGKQDGNSTASDRFQSPGHAQSQPGQSLACTANLAKRCAAGMTLIPACSSLLRFCISAAAFSSDLGAGATTAPSAGGSYLSPAPGDTSSWASGPERWPRREHVVTVSKR